MFVRSIRAPPGRPVGREPMRGRPPSPLSKCPSVKISPRAMRGCSSNAATCCQVLLSGGSSCEEDPRVLLAPVFRPDLAAPASAPPSPTAQCPQAPCGSGGTEVVGGGLGVGAWSGSRWSPPTTRAGCGMPCTDWLVDPRGDPCLKLFLRAHVRTSWDSPGAWQVASLPSRCWWCSRWGEGVRHLVHRSCFPRGADVGAE